ncbi:MAG: LysR family transcriptional regulator [Desulfomonile tiedjei]|uniref:LysR family transcriptional regulator n=1 Tax=Desulfomonile tiedjei TaxID=2358 RepID=A0A9D6Z3L6_9BACT|nr:LysR family transcriptional regulator [Desulfomonile tiedjei]
MTIDLSLNQLRAFHFAANCGSISRAAEQLFITQPGVSAQIKALESRYDTQLFVRGKKKLELTKCGKRLHTITEKIFGLMEEADELLSHPEDAAPTILKIGSSKTLVRYFLARYIQRFRESFPKIQIQVNEGSSAEMVQGILNGRNELAIVGQVHYEPSLKIIPFIEDELVLLAAPGHRLCRNGTISIQDLKTENLILREVGSGTRRIVQEVLEARGVAPSVFIESGNVDFIKELVKMSKAVTFLARMGVDQDIAKGALRALPVREGPFTMHIDVVVGKDKRLSRAAEAFIESLFAVKEADDFAPKSLLLDNNSYKVFPPSL